MYFKVPLVITKLKVKHGKRQSIRKKANKTTTHIYGKTIQLKTKSTMWKMQIFTWECATCKTLLWEPQRDGDQSIRSQWNLHFALAGVFPRLPLASFHSDFIGFIASFEFSVQLRLLRHATESESMSNPVALPDLYFHWFCDVQLLLLSGSGA